MSGPKVEESSNYDNYMEADARKNDTYSIGLDKFFDEPLPVVLQDMTKAKKAVESDVWKSIYVHLKTQDDMVEFCTKINQMIPNTMKSTYHPLSDASNCLFPDDDIRVAIDPSKLVPKQRDVVDDVSEDKFWQSQWIGMPEFTQVVNGPYRTVTMKFRSKEDYDRRLVKT